jgi:hypothetical protein
MPEGHATARIRVNPRSVKKGDVVPVTLGRTRVAPTSDQILWVIIRNRTRALAFDHYRTFVNRVMCGPSVDKPGDPPLPQGATDLHNNTWSELRPFGVHAYEALKATTEFYLMHEVGIVPDDTTGLTLSSGELTDEGGRLGRQVTQGDIEQARREYYGIINGSQPSLPYLDLIVDRLGEIPTKPELEVPEICYGVAPSRLTGPLAIELIWSYWHEEGMLAQALNAIALRFQNVRNPRSGADPLMRFELDPLRPLNNFLWGYVEKEWDRMSVVRRAYEYEHEYGLALVGKAVPSLRTADRRSKFLSAFHHLLHLCATFYREDDDTTVIADGFPLLNALREVHLILAHGAHNQFGDLPWAARVEMLIQQWLLARPEMREFIGGRVMVPYREAWMDRVDTLKSVMGWTDVSVTHFHDLAMFGEQIILSIRYGNWTSIDNGDNAANWARYWRPEIQGYIHAYRAATGVDLTERVDDTLPAIHLRRQQPSLKGEDVGRYALPPSKRQARMRPALTKQNRETGGW